MRAMMALEVCPCVSEVVKIKLDRFGDICKLYLLTPLSLPSYLQIVIFVSACETDFHVT